MTPHAPKLFALEAWVADQLSAVGRTRLDRHLARCETCRAALTAMREYARLRDAARDLPMPELAWERLESALDREVARPQPMRGNGKLLALIPALAIAAAVAIGWVGISGQREAARQAARTSSAAPSQHDKHAVDAPRAGWITLGAQAKHAVGSAVVEGVTLRTEAGEELHLHLATNTGVVIGSNSEVVVSVLREHNVRLTLLRGSIASTVQKLLPTESYAVEAGAFSAEVRGTRFVVSKQGEDVRVDVHEGTVAVLQQGKQIDLLSTGKRFANYPLNPAETAPDRSVVGLDSASRDWPSLTLPPLPQVSAWHVANMRWAARTELAMRAPPSNLTLSFEDVRGKLHPLEVTLSAEGARIEESDIRAALQAEADARTGTLAPELISPVIQGSLPALRRCYERGLRRAQVEGRLVLAVRVAADGHVSRAQLRGDSALPGELTECIASQARGWVFPAPEGGPVAFEVPLNLKAASAP